MSDEYEVRVWIPVNMDADDLARLVFLRERSILSSFERDAGGSPPYTSGFKASASSRGTRGFYRITFAANDLDCAWAIWKLGLSNHGEFDWDIRHRAAAGVESVTVPDHFPEDL